MLNKLIIHEELEEYRETHQFYSTTTRLRGIPFSCADIVFSINKIPRKNFTKRTGFSWKTITNSPCAIFGRNFVLKIVDELLDE